MTNQSKYIEDLEKRIIRLIKERDTAIEKLQKLEMEKQVLINKLAFFVNPHTPSSARKFPKKTDETQV